MRRVALSRYAVVPSVVFASAWRTAIAMPIAPAPPFASPYAVETACALTFAVPVRSIRTRSSTVSAAAAGATNASTVPVISAFAVVSPAGVRPACRCRARPTETASTVAVAVTSFASALTVSDPALNDAGVAAFALPR